jgi:hypothetical protein
MNPIKIYGCTKELLYTICLACWNSCSNYQSNFAAFKALYTPVFITDAIARVQDARALPDSRQVITARAAARIKLIEAAADVKVNWQMLKAYITQAYSKEMAPAMLEGAGASLYKKASGDHWSSIRSLIDAANSFITQNLAALTENENMPETFPAVFQSAGENFVDLSVTFFRIDNAKKMIVTQKIEANNAIYESLISMLKDGQQIFKDDIAIKNLFVFEQQLATRKGTGSASLSGHIKNEIQLPVVGALITSNELGYQAFTNSKGHFSIKRMVAGDYNITVSFPGYTPAEQAISLTAGVASKLNLTLANAMKKVA